MQAKECYICGKPFTEKDKKVADHDHFDGHYRGALHNTCNLKFRKAAFIPVFFHNLKGYDSHLFMRAFADLDETPDGNPENS